MCGVISKPAASGALFPFREERAGLRSFPIIICHRLSSSTFSRVWVALPRTPQGDRMQQIGGEKTLLTAPFVSGTVRSQTLGRSADSLCPSSPSPSLCADEVGYCHDLSSIFKTLKTLLHWCLGPPCSQLSFSIFWRSVLPCPTLQSRSSLISLSHPFVNSN